MTAQKAAITLERVRMASGFSGGGTRGTTVDVASSGGSEGAEPSYLPVTAMAYFLDSMIAEVEVVKWENREGGERGQNDIARSTATSGRPIPVYPRYYSENACL